MTNTFTEDLIYRTLTKLDERGDNEIVTKAMSIVRVILDAERQGHLLSSDEVFATAVEKATRY